MQKFIELKKDENILVSSMLESSLQPDAIYLPVQNGKIFVHQNDCVKIGEEVLEGVLSPISGTVKSLKRMHSLAGDGYYLEIANDFEERYLKEVGKRRKIKKEDILKVFNLDGMKNFVLNAIDDEIYVSTQNFYLYLYYDAFLELLDEIEQIFPDLNVYVCVKASSSENVSKLMSDLGMYPNIILKIVPDYYLLGRKLFLLSYLGLDVEKSFILSAGEFYDIYNYLKRSRTKSDLLLTISGDACKNPMVIQVKIGTLLKDIVKEKIEILNGDICYFANGLMSGQEISLDSFVVTTDLQSLLIMKKKKEPKARKCIRCGLCSELCPFHLHPYLFGNPKYQHEKERCINCGLCSYICPVYIHFYKESEK